MPTPNQRSRRSTSGIRSRIQGGLEVATAIPTGITNDGRITLDVGGPRQVRDIGFYALEQGAAITAVVNPKGLGFYVN